ncbi:MAG: hypothetical protein ACRC2T_12600, partial [Thermoguttaceae bacterium]
QNAKESNQRLIWRISPYFDLGVHFTPIIQTFSDISQCWEDSKRLSINALYESFRSYHFLSEQDKYICNHLKVTPSIFGFKCLYQDEAPVFFIGHPLLFSEESPEQQVVFEEGVASITLKKYKKKTCVKCYPKILRFFTGDPIQCRRTFVVQESANVYKVIHVTELQFYVLYHHTEFSNVYTPRMYKKLKELLRNLKGKILIKKQSKKK